MKKKLLSLALMTIFISLMALGSAAFFTKDAYATNIITTGTVDLTLTETSEDGTVVTDEEGNSIGFAFAKVMPSQTLDKHPVVENTGTQEFWLRVKILESMTAVDGSDLPLFILEGETEIPVLAYNDMNENWVAGEDGWLYYNAPLKTGEKVEIFSSVTLAPQMGNEYQDASGRIDIQAQAVQSKNNEIPEGGSVLDVQGWPVESAE